MKINLKIALTLFCLLALTACSGQPMGGGSSSGENGGTVRLQGVGASFPEPIYRKWLDEYGKANASVKIDYQANGSSAGVNGLLQQTADFGASDAAMTEDEMKKAPTEIVHVPTVLGAVVLTYNLPGLSEPLKLSPETVAEIYLGKIKKWDDAKIKADNQSANLPATDIVPVYRADGSGTTYVFTDYLSKANADWKSTVGTNKQPSWVKGVGKSAPRNDGVMGEVKQTANSIGYVELTFAKTNKLPVALIKNSAGNFVEANDETVAAAASETAAQTPDDLRVEITNAAGANAYPIASYTYVLIYKDQKDAGKGKAMTDFLWWATHDGQKFAKDLYYTALPAAMVMKVESRLKLISNAGKSFRQ